MKLELAADPQTVAGLVRLKGLTACREGRSRTQTVKIVWHDSPELGLLGDGLTLAEQRGVRRLERVFPGSASWLPGQPVPIVAEAPDPASLPAPLASVAAFEGRQTMSEHVFGGQPVSLTIWKGSLRAVTAERPVARIWLSGAEQAVREAVVLIAGAESVAVPLHALAAEAIALATGRSASPRHAGAPVLPAEWLSVAGALAHILGHLTDVMLANAPLAAVADDAGPEAVHQMRVAVRRARSALAVFHTTLPAGALDPFKDRLKQLSAKLGPTRDWDVFADETAPAIHQAIPGDARLDRLITAACRLRRSRQKALAAYLDSAEFRLLGIELAWFAAAEFWHAPAVGADGEPQPPPPLAEFAAGVLQHYWKKLISIGKRIDELDVPSLHGVRLRAKRARYAAEMFSTLHHGKASHRFLRRLSALQQRLGVLNDGAVASHLLAELGGPSGRHGYATGIVVGFLAARAAKIRPRIVDAFDRFRRQPAYWT